MPTFFLDLVGGSDAADGTTYANRWLTINAGPTAGLTAPGDTIRLAKTPDPVSLGINATFTNSSDQVTLASALTANITDCGTIWTSDGGANVVVTTSGTRQEGTLAASIAIGAGFTTGLAAHFATGTLDLSTYQQVSFWIRTSAAIATGDMRLTLCTATDGTSAVHNIAIPAIAITGVYVPITVDLATNMNSAIKSIGLNVLVDKGAVTVLLDNILACKDAATGGALTLRSLIGKNTGSGVTEEDWYAIKSINGTAVVLDNGITGSGGNNQCYLGSTATVTAYRRECFHLAVMTSGTYASLNEGGTSGNLITYSGGWDNTGGAQMTTQNGETWINGQSKNGVGLNTNSKLFVRLEKISFVRWATGLILHGTTTDSELDFVHACCCQTRGIYIQGSNCDNIGTIFANGNIGGSSVGNMQIDGNSNYIEAIPSCGGCLMLAGDGNEINTIGILHANGSGPALLFSGANQNLIGTITEVTGAAGGTNGSGIVYINVSTDNIISDMGTVHDNGTTAFACGVHFSLSGGGCTRNQILKGTTTANRSCGIGWTSSVTNHVGNITYNEATHVATPSGLGARGFVTSINEGGSTTAHFIYYEFALIKSDTGTVHSSSAYSWKMSPTSTTKYTATSPLILTVLVPVTAAPQSLKIWARRDSTTLKVKARILKNAIPGVTVRQTATMTASANTWEELTLTFTPTLSGIVAVQLLVYGGTTLNGWFDDMTLNGVKVALTYTDIINVIGSPPAPTTGNWRNQGIALGGQLVG